LSKGKSNARWVYAYWDVHSRLPKLVKIPVRSATEETELRGKALAAKNAGIELDQVLCFPSNLEYECFKCLVDRFGFTSVQRHVKITLNEEYEIYWVVDFWVTMPDGRPLCVESKGIETSEFKYKFRQYNRTRDLHPGKLPRLLIVRSVKDLKDQLSANNLIPVQTVLL
jgi:hypothetical protein